MEGDPQLPPVESTEQSVTLNLAEMTDEQIVALVGVAALDKTAGRDSPGNVIWLSLLRLVETDQDRGLAVTKALAEHDNPNVRKFGTFSLLSLSEHFKALDGEAREREEFAEVAVSLATDPRGEAAPYWDAIEDRDYYRMDWSIVGDVLCVAMQRLYEANVELVELRSRDRQTGGKQ